MGFEKNLFFLFFKIKRVLLLKLFLIYFIIFFNKEKIISYLFLFKKCLYNPMKKQKTVTSN